MPYGAYFKGSGNKVKRDMQQRYGADWKSYFYGTAAKRGLRPRDKTNLLKPKRGKQTAAVRKLVRRAYGQARKWRKGR